MNSDLTYINRLLRRFNIYVYDRDKSNMYTMMEMEVSELYKSQLISKEEFLHSKVILKKRMRELK